MATPEPAFPPDLVDQLRAERVFAVCVVEDADAGLRVAEALRDGGIRSIELAQRTPGSLAALRAMADRFPDMRIGAGTVLRPDQVTAVADAGAAFAVAPGFNARVVDRAREIGLPYAPGIATPSELEAALERGCRLLKFFPAMPIGGLAYLKAIAGPYRLEAPLFLPLGGVSEGSLASWLESPLVGAVGGSWLTPAGDIAAGRFDAIRERAARAVAIAQDAPTSQA